MTEALDRHAQPIIASERLAALDLLRGVAIFGILMVNMAFFALPFMLAVYPDDKPEWTKREWVAYLIVKIFFEYKFVSLFSLLFGAGLIVQMTRAQAGSARFAPRYFRRIALLAVFGLLHGLLLWYGDILFIYALIGTILFLLRGLQPRTMLITAASLLLFASLLSIGFLILSTVGDAPSGLDPHAHASPLRGIEAMAKAQWNPEHAIWIDAERLAYAEGPLADALAFRVTSFLMCLFFTVAGFGWHILAMFLIGAAMMKARFFAPERRSGQGRLAMITLPIGLTLEATSAALIALSPAPVAWDDMVAGWMHEWGAATLCLGYVGLGAWIANSPRGEAPTFPIRSVGRMALTNYLLSTTIVTFLMYHWGLGWFGSVSRSGMIVIAVSVYAALVLFSMAWLRFFRFGPVEWLWRSVTYRHAQPMKR
jgi:uncharacterized protein